MAVRIDLAFIQGDDTQLQLNVTNDDATPYDLTGKRLELLVKRYIISTDAIFQLSSVDGAPPRITITDAVNGLATVDLTNLLDTTVSYWYDSWVADVSDPDVDKQTWAWGAWTVTPAGAFLGLSDAPCTPWPIDEMCMQLPAGTSASILETWQAVSTDILWALSGRRWGVCTKVVRPCRRSCADRYMPAGWWQPGSRWYPYISGGVWRNASICGCSGSCSCGELCEVYLESPVNTIIEVTIDGAVIDPADYRVDAPGLLVRQNGGCWPSCQDLSAPAGAEGSFVVTYGVGLTLTAAAIAANSELTAELIKACLPDCEDCRLPRSIASVIQQGAQYQFVNPQDFLKDGRTGLYLVDLWLEAVNPNSLPAPLKVRSPDFRGPRTTIIQ